ncbi:MAG TPA: hypothetical protein VH109_12270 [Steroidobacteraceae bacterium]|nr:hypothetical protein [Steroidobacteraceae bacterium]
MVLLTAPWVGLARHPLALEDAIMRCAVAMLALLTTGALSVAIADPPATAVAPQSPSHSTPNSTAEHSTGQDSPSQTPPATGAPTAAEAPVVAPAKPAPNASDEQMQKLLRDQGYKPTMVDGEKKFCRREIPMGSHLATALQCVTVEEAKEIAREGQQFAERAQKKSPGCLSPGTQHGAVNCGN